MKKILRNLNKKWGLDITLATAGNCCNSCSTFRSEKMEADFEKAKTYLKVKWFQSGMNYNGKFEEQDMLHVGYDLGDKVTITEVCNDLAEALKGLYEVFQPIDDSHCIRLKTLFTIEYMAIFYDDKDGNGNWQYWEANMSTPLDRIYEYGYCDYYITINQDGVITASTYSPDYVGKKLIDIDILLYDRFRRDMWAKYNVRLRRIGEK